MVDQDPVKAILRVHADLAIHSIMKATAHPVAAGGRITPEAVLGEVVSMLIRDGVAPDRIVDAVNRAVDEAAGSP